MLKIGNLNNFLAITILSPMKGVVVQSSSIHTSTSCTRYYAEKLARGPLTRFYGRNQKEKLHVKGLLPRDPHATSPLPMKVFAPKNKWSEKNALFGQNDYIDILGDGSLHPTDLMYGVPEWLRAFKANELQVLIRQRKMFGQEMLETHPTRFHQMEHRIKWLYKRLNFHKSQDFFWR